MRWSSKVTNCVQGSRRQIQRMISIIPRTWGACVDARIRWGLVAVACRYKPAGTKKAKRLPLEELLREA
jgi:hypothetical protein